MSAGFKAYQPSKEKAPDQKRGFSHIPPNVYSHGLEAIYTLENIDVSSIKKINPQPAINASIKHLSNGVNQNSFFSVKNYIERPNTLQLEFDFGPNYRGYMPSFILLESIHVLSLSPLAEKCLREHRINTIQQLLSVDPKDLIFFKGMGQGHIDEIFQQLNIYLKGKSLEASRLVNFSALVRSLFPSIDLKKNHIFLSFYGLQELFPLSSAEVLEVKRLSIDKKKGIHDALLNDLYSQKTILHEKLKQFTDVFIIPWIEKRGGLSSKEELIERMERISESPTLFLNIHSFLSKLFYEDDFILKKLLSYNKDIYFSREIILNYYYVLIEKAYKYFYCPTAEYPFLQFIKLLFEDFAKEWHRWHYHQFSFKFIKNSLELSPEFRIRKKISSFKDSSCSSYIKGHFNSSYSRNASQNELMIYLA